jgi:GrpB-like predicted nucleotidyltransferase (UPF0157 family)
VTDVSDWLQAVGGGPVELAEPDPSWPRQFVAIRLMLDDALGTSATRIDHIGSTAVPGIPAKPVIDVQVSVPDLEAEEAYRPRIEGIGWPMLASEPEHRFFRPPDDQPRTVHVHVCQAGSAWERAHLLFRDYLRAHPDSAKDYAALKRRLLVTVGHDRPVYSRSKDPFVAETLARAEDWARVEGWQP